MLTYNEDIFKKILVPAGVDCYASAENKKFVVPTNVQTVWEMVFPLSLRSMMSVISYSAFNGGNSDSRNGNDGRRNQIKYALKSPSSEIYKNVNEHIGHLIEENALLKLYSEHIGMNRSSITVTPVTLKSIATFSGDKIEERKKAIRETIGNLILECKDEIKKDTRISYNFRDYIFDRSKEDPDTALEILVILSLFAHDDNDKDFFHCFENHYMLGSIEVSADRNEDLSVLSHELTNTPVIDISEANVLYREEEVSFVINALENEKAKSVVLSGMGGCGKTSIARLVYKALKQKYDCCGWVNYTGNLKQSMITAIDLGEEDAEEDSIGADSYKKKWVKIVKTFKNNNRSKFLVIDNVDYVDGIQNPLQDKDLAGISSWDNTYLLITSRLPHIDGFYNVKEIGNLGDKKNCDKCVELFYFYNPQSRKNKDKNGDIVRELCRLAGYNTMVIELLAKASIYDELDEFYDRFVDERFNGTEDVPVRTLHDYNMIPDMNETEDDYFDAGNETAASQLIKLFNMKSRSETEQQILWDFHCLSEGEKVSKKELTDWLEYSLKEINSLREEGWIKFEDGSFFIHPLVQQAIACQDQKWRKFWDLGMRRRNLKGKGTDIISRLLGETLFSDKDTFAVRIRLLMFADRLTFGGRPLEPEILVYIADNARRAGVKDLSVRYYKAAYDKLNQFKDDTLKTNKLEIYWKATYFYGYMLSYSKVGYDKGEKLIREALEIIKDCMVDSSSNDRHIMMMASSYDHLGYILSSKADNDIALISEADMYLEMAVDIRRLLCESHDDNARFLHDYAWSLDNLGFLYAGIDIEKLKRPEVIRNDIDYLSVDDIISGIKESETYFKEARRIRKLLASVSGNTDSVEVAWTCSNYAMLLMHDVERFDETRKLLDEAMSIYRNLRKREPELHETSGARACMIYGQFLSQYPEHYEEAIRYYEEALRINMLSESFYPGDYVHEIAITKKEMEDLRVCLNKL